MPCHLQKRRKWTRKQAQELCGGPGLRRRSVVSTMPCSLQRPRVPNVTALQGWPLMPREEKKNQAVFQKSDFYHYLNKSNKRPVHQEAGICSARPTTNQASHELPGKHCPSGRQKSISTRSKLSPPQSKGCPHT